MILYHGTPPANVDSILRDGLRPGKPGDYVYLARNIADAIRFGQEQTGEVVVFEVSTPDDFELRYFEGCEDWELLGTEPIPPEWLTLLTEPPR